MRGEGVVNGELPPEIRARHLAFRERTAGPLVGHYRHSIYPMEDFVGRLPGGTVEPADTNPARWLELYEESWHRAGLLWGDLLSWSSPLNGFPWVEAIAGCPIYSSRESRSVWAAPRPDYRPGSPLPFDPENPWLRALLAATRALVELSAGRFPVAPGIMRGVSDLLAALLGPERFYLALHDEPDAVAASAVQAAELWIEVVGAQYREIPPFSGGYVNAGLYAAVPCPVYQEDAAASISPRTFERILGGSMRRALAAYPAPVMHLHSAGLQILPSVLAATPPPVVEINLDPSGPALDDLWPKLRCAQQAAPLEIFGTREQVERCLHEWPDVGVAYLIS